MSRLKNIFFCFIFLLGYPATNAQKPAVPRITINGDPSFIIDSSRRVCIKEIIVKGARKTKVYIVLREMQFKTGDSIRFDQLYHELHQAREQVYNTTLFFDVRLEATITGPGQVRVTVNLKERWYIFPVPQFQLVDRNFNIWAKTYKYSFDRVNYGVKFVHYNLSGRKDPLRIYLFNGYSRNISFSYTAPYSNSALTEGFTVGGGIQQNREIAYKTAPDNTVLFYPVDSAEKLRSEFVRNIYFVNGGYIIRRGLFRKHIITAGYTRLKVADSVVSSKYNPNYFQDPVNAKGFVDLTYSYQYTNVNNVLYPLIGTSYFGALVKRGLGFSGGINMLSLEGGLNKYYPLGKHWYSAFQLYGKIKLPFAQAFINQRGLGYGENYLRGQEYYVIDGPVSGLLRTTLKKKIASFFITLPFLHKVIPNIPFTFFAKTYADLGYVYAQKAYSANLNNRLLYTGGLGLDILTLYDVNLRLEYSFNQLNQKGLFFHTQGGF